MHDALVVVRYCGIHPLQHLQMYIRLQLVQHTFFAHLALQSFVHGLYLVPRRFLILCACIAMGETSSRYFQIRISTLETEKAKAIWDALLPPSLVNWLTSLCPGKPQLHLRISLGLLFLLEHLSLLRDRKKGRHFFNTNYSL